MMRSFITLAAAAVLLGVLPLKALELAVNPEVPAEGEPASITVTWNEAPVAGATVKALYRPNSEVSVENELGTTDSFGRIAWQPRDAGLVSLTAAGAGETVHRDVSVRFSGVPWRGLMVLLLAGLILFGGNAMFIIKTLQAKE
ncbi:MAG: hypothetical protein KJ970_08430 [Candidatus Eisenbacteria bacterium]|uniref:Uncharacterized protein n=1 Tax=Eiseniibacteriota bacterium TaxID=2212470 RepID=A0A948W6S3_UNCEI|nr:hypothetical protein [Candidatus Eisenbacteria bacterium]MBU1950524.1 hypothetical protein [Candidatus Eisenbacteria bacterium]MBU2690941.1 hypothetical protein [Candidatus Eisenbacteria bacterium]